MLGKDLDEDIDSRNVVGQSCLGAPDAKGDEYYAMKVIKKKTL